MFNVIKSSHITASTLKQVRFIHKVFYINNPLKKITLPTNFYWIRSDHLIKIQGM